MADGSDTNYEALRAGQAADLLAMGSSCLGYNGFVAYAGGIPPGARAILNPEKLSCDVASGQVPEAQTPFGQVCSALEEMCGPATVPNFRGAFTNANPSPYTPVNTYEPFPFKGLS